MNPRTIRWLPRPSLHHKPTPPLLHQIRHKSWFNFSGSKDEPTPNPKSTTSPPNPKSTTPSPKPFLLPDLNIQRGSLAENTLFKDELTPDGLPAILTTNPLTHDPDRHKWTWPKRADAREHRRRGRLTKKEKIMRTEKEHVAKSHFFKTSLKKLGPIARQITGKNVDDAIVQMRFSAKKAARDVLGHLNQARDEAMLRRSMDPKVMYVEQAWVGRGPYGEGTNHRAKGRIDRLRLPYTS